jgi:phosphohistidine phosphatase
MSSGGLIELYLVRHGAAEDGPVDRSRRLSPEGRAEVQALAELFEARGVKPDRILHSGYRRAEETAEILAEATRAPARKHQGLAPEDDPALLVAELLPITGSSLIVSHMPFLGSLARQLVGEQTALPEFRTSSIVCLAPIAETQKPHRWQLVWHGSGRS